MGTLRIAIVGDFDHRRHGHWATEAALFHAAARLGVAVEPTWVATPTLADPDGVKRLATFAGVWAAPGSPYQSMPGMLNGIGYARAHDLPFLGTCGGFQYALIELTRSLLGVADADTAENAPEGENIVITPVSCGAPTRQGPTLNGASKLRLTFGSSLRRLCGGPELIGEFFCSFETNPDFVPRLEAVGVRVSARGEDGAMRALELPTHRFFLATLFQPQLSSSFDQPHPIVLGFLEAASSKS